MARNEQPKRQPPMGVSLATDIETRAGRGKPYRARVRWVNPATGDYPSLSRSHDSLEEAQVWITEMQRAAAGGVDPSAATMVLSAYGDLNMTLALRGLEAKTTDPYLAGWRKRVVPTLGHLPVVFINAFGPHFISQFGPHLGRLQSSLDGGKTCSRWQCSRVPSGRGGAQTR